MIARDPSKPIDTLQVSHQSNADLEKMQIIKEAIDKGYLQP